MHRIIKPTNVEICQHLPDHGHGPSECFVLWNLHDSTGGRCVPDAWHLRAHIAPFFLQTPLFSALSTIPFFTPAMKRSATRHGCSRCNLQNAQGLWQVRTWRAEDEEAPEHELAPQLGETFGPRPSCVIAARESALGPSVSCVE
eukprot:jgi/Ulvmu1/1440/UM011_0170.1